MSRKSHTLLAMVLLVAAGLPARAGEIIDRIVATVNRNVILQSDWDDAVRYETFIGGRPLDHITNEDRKTCLDRLIDQELLREQVHLSNPAPSPDEQEVAKRIAEIRKQYPGAETESGWLATLGRYSLTEAGLRDRVAAQIDLMALVEARLRASVTVDASSIQRYYNQELLPQLHQSHAQDVPLSEVTPRIKELLTEQKVSELLTTWLHSLRAGSEIHTVAPSSDSQGQAQ
jgi:peptidyl-prolyl cis-trans isomerase SurA